MSEEVKLYFDYKSPYAFLAAEPAFDFPERYGVNGRWIPFQLRIKGKGERSVLSEFKVRYSYMDARRWANRRGGFPLRGPRKIYDTSPALLGAYYAMDKGSFREFTMQAFGRFFDHKIELDVADEVAALVTECGGDADDYRGFLAGEGQDRFEAGMAEAHEDQIFGVPIFSFRGELFWGYDRIPLLEERMQQIGSGREEGPQ